MRVHSPQQQFKEAQQIARDHNMFVVEKDGIFLLYRRTPTRPAFLGRRSNSGALRQLVCKCADFK